MPNFNHPRDVMPFAIMLYLLMSMAQLHATQKSPSAPGFVVTMGKALSSLEGHMLEIAQNERSESLSLFPGP
jgi:hypothetical protein